MKAQQGALATGRSTWNEFGIPWIDYPAPERIVRFGPLQRSLKMFVQRGSWYPWNKRTMRV